MRLPLLAAVALVGVAATGASAATRDFPASNFTQVDLKAAADVTIRQGTGFSVHADGDQQLVDRLTAEVRNGVLLLGWKPGSWIHTNNGDLHVTITMPRTTAVAIGGAGSIDLDHGSGPAFGANVAGAGTIKVASVRADRVALAMSGTGHIVVAGSAGELAVNGSGVGSVDAAALTAKSAAITMSGTGHVHAHVDGPVAVSLSGIGDVVVDGHAQCAVHKSGLGDVHCG